MIAHKINVVAFKIKGRIDAVLIYRHRVRPFAMYIIGMDDEVAHAGYIGGGHIETAIVKSDGGGIDAACIVSPFKGQLAFPRQHMSDLRPVDEIPAFEERDPGEILETAAHEIIGPVRAADARIREESADDWISVCQICIHNVSSCSFS